MEADPLHAGSVEVGETVNDRSRPSHFCLQGLRSRSPFQAKPKYKPVVRGSSGFACALAAIFVVITHARRRLIHSTI